MEDNGIDLDSIIKAAEQFDMDETIRAEIPVDQLKYLENYNKKIPDYEKMFELEKQEIGNTTHNIRMHISQNMEFCNISRKEAFILPNEN